MNDIGRTYSINTADSYTTTPDGDWSIGGGNYGVGQTFTGNGEELYSATFKIYVNAAVNDFAYAKIYNITGTHGTDAVPTGDPIAVSQRYNVSNLTASVETDVELFFIGDNRITLADGTNYAVVFECAREHADRIYVKDENTTVNHAGNQVILSSSWTAYDAYDTYFTVKTRTYTKTTDRTLKSAPVNENFTALADGSAIENDAIVDRHVAVADDWTSLTLQNSWATYATEWATPAYRKDVMGFVHLRGLVKNGSSTSAVVATLPTGYRPGVRMLFSSITSGENEARVDVTTAGEITPISIPNTTWLNLNDITFYAEG